MLRASCIVLVLVIFAGVSMCSFQAPDGEADQAGARQGSNLAGAETWRTPDHDGVNCLYLLLAMWGRDVPYEEVQRALEGREHRNTLVGLRNTLGRLGLKTGISKGGLAELAPEHLPAIIHVEGFQKNTGHFALVFAVNDRQCHMVNGASATIETVPIDEFRRSWSGYVLRPSAADNGWVLSLAGGLLALAGYGWWRWRSARSISPRNLRARLPNKSSNEHFAISNLQSSEET